MNATPRITKGAYPETPARAIPPTPSPSPPARSSPPQNRDSARQSLPLAPENTPGQTGSEPRIPTRILDAPSQRLYAVAIYFALVAWKGYDWLQLVEDNAESFWLWLKWVAIDLVFIFGLPELRIPWLELSQPVAIALFFLHALLDWMLMFQIPVPWMSWVLGFVKVFYDRELSISENYVKSSSILHNQSLIQGRQIINILPEGSAVLNPEQIPFCVGGTKDLVKIPIQFNATIPREVEIVRTDFDPESTTEETLRFTRSQIRSIENQAKRLSPDGSPSTILFEFPVKKPGAYKLRKVLDEYKLEVQRKSPHTFVVPCPSVSIGPSASSERCINDLSNLVLNVDGTPPLKIVYSRTINGKDHSFHFQSLQPEGFSSPLTGTARLSSSLTVPEEEDTSWARPQRVTVALNESLYLGGDWQYSVDEVHDAFGNVVKYASLADDFEGREKPKNLVQNFSVKERPRVYLSGCDVRNPLKIARGRSVEFPVVYERTGPKADDRVYTLTWDFSPIDTLTKNGDPGDVVEPGSHTGRLTEKAPRIKRPGLYTLKAVTAGSCEGEVREPSSCLVLAPPAPDLTLRSREIPDVCAGNTVGLEVDMDLVGTPPFVVHYDEIINGDTKSWYAQIPGLRYQMELLPRLAGTHKYVFKSIDDALYSGMPLMGAGMTLEQNVKPAASASMELRGHSGTINACLDDQVDLDVNLFGEPPFALEYELIHDEKRTPYKVTDIESNRHSIRTPELSQGGEYTVALTSVQDRRGCRNSVQNEVKIAVRRQRPRAAFGLLDGKRRALNIENVEARLPLRLTGDGPWTLTYRNLNETGSPPTQVSIRNSNGHLKVLERGVYEILEVSDNQCQGAVDPKAAVFEVDWLPRPVLSIVESESIAGSGHSFIKRDVCEGDIDVFEIGLKGSPPYHVEYNIRHKPTHGSASSILKKFDAALGKELIPMDTAKPGLYTYTFSSLADSLYELGKKQFTPLTLEQRVNAKPTAHFDKPGQTFKFCMAEQENEERIPITLTGVAPFFVELEIKHHSGVVPQVHHVAAISSAHHGVRLPRELLRLGSQQVRIREVRDARGCQSRTEVGGPSVQVQLYDAPAIYPLETRTDYCVGERIAYTLSGTPPFEVTYTFDGVTRSARVPTTNFRRMADSPGEFAITSISDKASECRAAVRLAKQVRPMPSVRISRGRNVRVDIHEGGEVEILFEFWGTPPFEFTYTRSTNQRKKGQRPTVLETRHDVSHEHSKVIRASQEGTYEVVAIKDKYCAFSTQSTQGVDGGGGAAQKLLQYT